MAEIFDPYHKWLGIPPNEQPADHYRLLGLRMFESDLDVIESATDRQMMHVRTFQNGPRAKVSQKLLNELTVVRLCLLDVAKREQYDATLRQSLKREEPGVHPTPLPPVGSITPEPLAPGPTALESASPEPTALRSVDSLANRPPVRKVPPIMPRKSASHRVRDSNLIACPNCGRHVLRQSTSCPGCGSPFSDMHGLGSLEIEYPRWDDTVGLENALNSVLSQQPTYSLPVISLFIDGGLLTELGSGDVMECGLASGRYMLSAHCSFDRMNGQNGFRTVETSIDIRGNETMFFLVYFEHDRQRLVLEPGNPNMH